MAHFSLSLTALALVFFLSLSSSISFHYSISSSLFLSLFASVILTWSLFCSSSIFHSFALFFLRCDWTTFLFHQVQFIFLMVLNSNSDLSLRKKCFLAVLILLTSFPISSTVLNSSLGCGTYVGDFSNPSCKYNLFDFSLSSPTNRNESHLRVRFKFCNRKNNLFGALLTIIRKGELYWKKGGQYITQIIFFCLEK